MPEQKNELLSLIEKYINKRIDDLQSYLKMAILLISGITTVIAGFIYFDVKKDLSEERQKIDNSISSALNSYEEFKGEVLNIIGASNKKPNLVLLTVQNHPLNGAVIQGKVFQDEKGTSRLSIKILVRNEGKGKSGPIIVKLYSSDFRLPLEEVDRTGFKWEGFVLSEDFKPRELFGGMSAGYIITTDLAKPYDSKKDSSEMLVRYYYDEGLISESRFRVRIEQQ